MNMLDDRQQQLHDIEMLDCVPPIVEPLVTAVRDGVDLKTAMAAALQEFEFDTFSISRRNLDGAALGLRWTIWSQRPKGWFDCFREKRYAAIDPIRKLVLQSPQPVIWDRRRFAGDRQVQPFLADFASFGMSSGVCMIIHRPDGRNVDFFGATSSLNANTDRRYDYLIQRMSDLWALAAYCHALLPQTAIDLKGGWSYARPGLLELRSRRLFHLASVTRRRGSR